MRQRRAGERVAGEEVSRTRIHSATPSTQKRPLCLSFAVARHVAATEQQCGQRTTTADSKPLHAAPARRAHATEPTAGIHCTVARALGFTAAADIPASTAADVFAIRSRRPGLCAVHPCAAPPKATSAQSDVPVQSSRSFRAACSPALPDQARASQPNNANEARGGTRHEKPEGSTDPSIATLL